MICPTCGQPMPEQPRRDPPLAPLEQPNLVTIHDLPEGERARAKVERGSGPFHCVRLLRTARDVVDGWEGGR